MKRILGILLILFSTITFGQFTGEPKEVYVGNALGKYPLTLNGLQRAITSLNGAGIVRIAYPGIDTTGLGVLDPDIYIEGWIDSSYVNTIPLTFTSLSTNYYNFPDSAGTSGYVLKTNGLGQTYWAADNTGAGGIVTWGDITGTLSNQTDLNSALNGKVSLTGSYSDPSWITSLAWSKISGEPTTLSGYGITDATPTSRTLTINGVTQDLSANRSWTIAGGSGSDSSAIFNIEGWYYQDLPASQTEQILSKGNGSITHRYYPTRSVSLTKLSIASNSSTQVTGTATAVVFKNGTATGVTVQLNSTYDFYNLAEFGIEELTLSSGSYIDIRITTSSDWNQTPDILVTAEFSTNEIDTNTISFDSITNYIYTEVAAITQYSLLMQNPDSSESFTVFRTKKDIIIDSVYTLVQGQSVPSVSWNISYGTNRTSGTDFYTVGNLTSSNTTIGSTTIPSGENYETTIPINNLIWVKITDTEGTPEEFLCVIYYHY